MICLQGDGSRMSRFAPLPLGLFLLIISAFAAARADTELLTNGDFGAGTKSWTLDRLHNANASFKVEPAEAGKAAAHVEVADAAEEPYYVQLFQDKLNITDGKAYHLRFRARGSATVKIRVNVMLGEAPWTNLWAADVALGIDWKDYSFDITPRAATSRGRLTFTWLGAQPANYWFTGVSLSAQD